MRTQETVVSNSVSTVGTIEEKKNGSIVSAHNLVTDINQKFLADLPDVIRFEGNLTKEDTQALKTLIETDWAQNALNLENSTHRELAARLVSLGAVMCYGFGNFYAITAHPRWESVRAVNRSKGRPETQVGSVTTTKEYMEYLFDWNQLPAGVKRDSILSLMDDFYEKGPFGFRGPAAEHILDHLTKIEENGVRVTQLIAPGFDCYSNDIFRRTVNDIEEKYLFITSANVSHHITGAKEEPAHYKIKGIQKDFGATSGYFMVAHQDEQAIQEKYTNYAPMSTTIISFHNVFLNEDKKPTLVLERHGSLHFDEVLKIVQPYGFELIKGSNAQTRLPQREYQP